MTPYVKHAQKRRRPYGTIVVLLAAAAALAWILVPMYRGETPTNPLAKWLPGLFPSEVLAAEKETPKPNTGPAPGRVRVLISGRTIPAYSKVVRDDIWNLARGTFAYTDIDEDVAEDGGVLIDVKDIVGRVISHEKRPGYAFTERDFLPKGTRPGLSAGVPAGKRALRVEVEKVHGIVGLQPGDRFDMVAGFSLETNTSSPESFVGLYSNLMGSAAAQSSTYPRARMQVLVQNGVVVTPLQTRQIPSTSTTLTSGTTVRTLPVQEMVIALDPEEVAPFMEALSMDATITCLARSGLPDDPIDSLTPSSEPVSSWDSMSFTAGQVLPDPGSMRVIESITDNDRTFVPVPGVRSREDPR